MIPGAENLSYWFWANDPGFPVQDVDVHIGETIPSWVGPATFGFMQWHDVDYNWYWHSFYIGAGSGQDAKAWCHTQDRRNYLVRNWFTMEGFHHFEFYQPAPSPVNLEHYPQVVTETGGSIK